MAVEPQLSSQSLSKDFIYQLYAHSLAPVAEPIVQLLAFEISENDPKEIIIRVSDGSYFIDCVLVGPYRITGQSITVQSNSQPFGSNGLKVSKYDIIRITDYFHKKDDSKICKLKIIVRKILQFFPHQQTNCKVGRPQEISHYIMYNENKFRRARSESHLMQYLEDGKITQTLKKVKLSEDALEIPNISLGSLDNPVAERKIEAAKEMDLTSSVKNIKREQYLHAYPTEKEKVLTHLNFLPEHNPEIPLTVKDIMLGYEGFFVGRLLRMKSVLKESKDKEVPTTMLFLGLLDSAGDMVRINLIGRTAIKEEKLLQKDKCYYIQGLELVRLSSNASYIKLREKEYKMREITNVEFQAKFNLDYYHWEHQNEHIEQQNVDVIGIIEDIEQKTAYASKEPKNLKSQPPNRMPREVIRVLIRNKFKLVKISFWADMMKALEKLNLRRKEIVIFEDIKKKKNVFLDYSLESNLLRLSADEALMSKFAHLMPSEQAYPNPVNIAEVEANQQNSSSSHVQPYVLNLTLSRIYPERMLIKICELCKKKINLHSAKCFECGSKELCFKYSITAEFADYAGAIVVSIFDLVAEKFIGMTANCLKALQDTNVLWEDKLAQFCYKQYTVGLEYKNAKYILRTIEETADIASWAKSGIQKSKTLLLASYPIAQ